MNTLLDPVEFIAEKVRESFAPGLDPEVTCDGPSVICKCRRPVLDWDALLEAVNGRVVLVSDDTVLVIAALDCEARYQILITDPIWTEG